MNTTIVHNLETDVQNSREGDQTAFGRIVNRYQQMVLAVAYSHTGDASLSEDIAQETFLAAWQRIARLRHPDRLPAWLAGIARNKARDAWRARKRDAQTADVVRAESTSPSAAEADQAVLVWESLEQMPTHYREVLVLYYREGRDVRETAALLGLTEDCVKQRMSRGRSMLRARVADAVEDVLTTARPNPAFTVAVLSALPAVATAQAAAQTAGEGAALGIAGKGVIAGSVGALVGLLGGMTGGFFGIWASIRNAPTLRARRFTLINVAQIYALVWCFLAYQGLCGVLLWQWPATMVAACVAGWAIGFPLLFVFVWWSDVRVTRIVREDVGTLPEPEEPLESSSLSVSRVHRAGALSLGLAIPASLAVAWWLQSMPSVRAGVFGIASAALSHYVFWRLFRWGLAAAADDAAFEETAPVGGVERWLHRTKPHSAEPSRRRQFWNDVGAMAGITWGPAGWLIVAPSLAGDWNVVAAVVANCVLVTALSAWLFARWSHVRHRIFFGAMLYLGLFDGGIIGLFADRWTEAAQGAGAGRDIWMYNWFGAAICFGLYLVFGLCMLMFPRWLHGPKNGNDHQLIRTGN